MTQIPYFSVIIPTHNRRENLLECLMSLEKQTFPLDQFEVIVSDDGSTDGTLSAVERFKESTRMDIAIIHGSRSGPGNARNAAARVARGAILAFTEDDIIVDPEWLDRAAAYFSSDKIAGVEGTTTVRNSSEPLRLLESVPQLGYLPCNLFIRKEVFDALGGYDSAFYDSNEKIYFREDADLGFRAEEAGHKIVLAKDVTASHPALHQSVVEAFKHAKRYFFDPLLYKKHPRLYRQRIEVKHLGPVRFARPFHYFCLFYIECCLVFFVASFIEMTILQVAAVLGMLLAQYAVRVRYERRRVPMFWDIRRTFAFLVLPFYYCYWFVRGCIRFHSWGSLT